MLKNCFYRITTVVFMSTLVVLGISSFSMAKVTLRWWSYYEPEGRAVAFAEIEKEYEKLHPDIDLESAHFHTGYRDRLVAAIAANDLPELCGVDRDYLFHMVSEGLVYELTDWYEASGISKRIIPWIKSWDSFYGKVYGMSGNDLFTQEWYYHKTLFAKLGLSEPKNLDELISLCKKVKEGEPSAFPILLGAREAWTDIAWLVMPIQVQTVGLTPIIRARDETRNYDFLLKTMEIVERLIKEDAIPQEVTGIDWPGSISMFANGKGAIFPAHTSAGVGVVASIKKVGKIEVDIFKDAILFVDDPVAKIAMGGGSIWAVPESNRYKKETLTFLEYLMSPEIQRRIVISGSGIVPFPEANEFLADPILKISAKHIAEGNPEAFYAYDYIPSPVLDAAGSAIMEMINGRKTPEGVINDMNVAAEKWKG